MCSTPSHCCRNCNYTHSKISWLPICPCCARYNSRIFVRKIHNALSVSRDSTSGISRAQSVLCDTAKTASCSPNLAPPIVKLPSKRALSQVTGVMCFGCESACGLLDAKPSTARGKLAAEAPPNSLTAAACGQCHSPKGECNYSAGEIATLICKTTQL